VTSLSSEGYSTSYVALDWSDAELRPIMRYKRRGAW
jgi:hypothetical protein